MKKIPLILTLLLIALCLLWELWLAPVRGAGTVSLLALKATPLALALRGFAKDRRYTYQWMTLAVWLYFTEGVVRGWGDVGTSRYLAWSEVLLSLLLFVTCIQRARQLRSRPAHTSGRKRAA